jgi:hypothetical protein
VDTDTYPGASSGEAALSRRLEELAAQAAIEDQPEPDLPVGPVLAAAITGLRAEIGAMRADLEALGARVGSSTPPAPAVDEAGSESFGDVVEERLAAIEDTLDGLAERFEALTRDSAMDAGERLASLDDRIAALAQSLHAERAAAAQHRERSGLAMQDQAGALDEWAEAVRGGLEDLGEAVTVSLGSLSTSVTAASTTGRDAERRHLEALISELSQTVDEAFGSISEQLATDGDPVESRLQEIHVAVLDGFGAARARLIEELSGTLSRLEEANGVTRVAMSTELTELRGDLADALDEVRERVEATVAGAEESIGTALEDLRDRVEATVGGADESIGAALEEHKAGATALQDGIAAAALHAKDSGKRVADLQEIVTRLDATLSDLQSDWRPQVDAVVAQGRASAQSVLTEVQAEVDAALAQMTISLANQVKAIDEVSGSLGGGTDRLVGAGQALLAYLGERDRWLERERDRVLHEVLDEFAQGLSAKERRAVSSRMGEALDRRRDARDAERFRRTETGQPAIEIPPIPPELTELAEPIVPRPPVQPAPPEPAEESATPPEPAVETATPAAPAVETPRPAKRSAAKRSAATPAVAKAAPAKRAQAKAAPAKRAPAKAPATARTSAARKSVVAKKATPAKAPPAKTAVKKAATSRSTAVKTGAKRAAPAKRAAKQTPGSSSRSR